MITVGKHLAKTRKTRYENSYTEHKPPPPFLDFFPPKKSAVNTPWFTVYDISGGAHDIALGVVREVGGVAGESVALMNVYVAYDASLAGTFEGALLYGRRMVS